MLNPQQFFQQIQENIAKISQDEPFANMEKNSKAVFNAMLAKMNVVTKEEFDTQQLALLSCYQRLEMLENQVLQLQERLDGLEKETSRAL